MYNNVLSMRNYLVLILLFSLLGSCQSNKLKTDEKKLVKKILSEEEKLALQEENRLEKEKLLTDSLAKLPKGFRFKEDRSIDLQNPPVIIDIANSLDSIKEIKLSNVASNIEYIRMQAIPDSTIPHDLKFKYYLMDNYIVASNLYGIHLYSSNNNDFTGNTVNSNNRYGIYLKYSNNNTLSSNIVNSNRDYGGGIVISYSSNNTLTNNTANSIIGTASK